MNEFLPPPPPPAAPPRRVVTVVREKASSKSSFCQLEGDAGEKPMELTPPSPPTPLPPTTSPPPVKSYEEGLGEAELRLEFDEFERGLHRIDNVEKAKQAKHALHKYGVT